MVDDGGSAVTDNEVDPPQAHSEQELVVNGHFSDAPEKLKSIE